MEFRFGLSIPKSPILCTLITCGSPCWVSNIARGNISEGQEVHYAMCIMLSHDRVFCLVKFSVARVPMATKKEKNEADDEDLGSFNGA